MPKWNIYKKGVILIALISCHHKNDIELIKKIHLKDYPSASAIEFHNGRLFIIGDDAATMMVLDGNYTPIQQVAIFSSQTKRIPKAAKADLEAAYIDNNKLVAVSSLSLPQRNKLLRVDLSDGKKKFDTVAISEFKLKAKRVPQLNIEGATKVGNQTVFASRANYTHRQNFLILASSDTTTIFKGTALPLDLPAFKEVVGVSGLEYDAKHDMLLFTASTEETPNAATDGKIGTSYLGVIRQFSKRLNKERIQAGSLIDLTNYLLENESQKIESVAIEESANNHLILHLAADNDNGESSLYKLKVPLSFFK